MTMTLKDKKIAVIGLGYVGLPLAIEFGRIYKTLGFDISTNRISELRNGIDKTLESSEEEISSSLYLSFSDNLKDLYQCDIFIVTVPTPINKFKSPDLKPLLEASSMLGKIIKKGDIIIYESTVYPGCTEEDCVPVLEKESGLKFNQDFYCGYSPERINPGDKVNRLTTIKKVTSGSTPEIAEIVDTLYKSIITAGTYKASSLKVAEASKAIENAQRDINISFVNELALIFDKIGIDTRDVLEAAGTKWNFLKFNPGLVGGHCIGVDPYYLAHKSESLGYHPQVILSGRKVNDGMGSFVGNKVIKLLISKGITVKGAQILILGITFKENCPDIRNTRIIDIRQELIEFGCLVDVYDPWANPEDVMSEFGFHSFKRLDDSQINLYQGIVLAVMHDQFKSLQFNNSPNKVIYDVKGILDRSIVDGRL